MSAPFFAVSLFHDVFAKEVTQVDGTIEDLAETIRATTAPTKAQLPLLKLARFGASRIPHTGSLRHDQNLIACSGVEGDYDGEQVSVDEAYERLLKANVAALICTTPSHTDEKPRWRVYVPFSQELPPQDRARMVDRLNGVLGGVLAAESWTLSQSFYYGHKGANGFRVEIVEGEFVDLLDDLDLIAIGKPAGANGAAGNGHGANGAARPGGPVDEAALIEAIKTGQSYHESCTRLLGKWVQQGIPFVEAQPRLLAIFDEMDESLRDKRWSDRRADVERIILDIYGKDARKLDDTDSELAAIQVAISALQYGDASGTGRIIAQIAAAKLPSIVSGKLLETLKEKSGSKIGDLRSDLSKAEKEIKSATRKRMDVSRGN